MDSEISQVLRLVNTKLRINCASIDPVDINVNPKFSYCTA